MKAFVINAMAIPRVTMVRILVEEKYWKRKAMQTLTKRSRVEKMPMQRNAILDASLLKSG